MNKSQHINAGMGFKGWTERRLFDTPKLKAALYNEGMKISEIKGDFNSLCSRALKNGISQERLFEILDSCSKPLFQTNKLWRFLNKLTNRSFAIPFITGFWTRKGTRDELVLTPNLVTNVGLKLAVEQIGGTTTTPVTAIALGSNSTAAANTDTALNTEITTNGGGRGAATVTNTTTTVTGDTEQWQKTFTFSGSLTIREEGLFDNNTSGGKMLARQTFADQAVVSGDTLQVTHKLQAARA